MIPSSARRYERLLLVEETIASGRAVRIAYDIEGRSVWCVDGHNPAAWSTTNPELYCAGVGFYEVTYDAGGRPVLLNESSARPIEASSWLARTYKYLSPVLGDRSVVLSSGDLFCAEILQSVRSLPEDAIVLEVGGATASRLLDARTDLQFVSVGPCLPNTERSTRNAEVEALAEAIPMADSSVDCVLCLFVFEHLVDPRRALAEMVRVLTPGGLLLLGVPVTESPQGAPPLFHRWQFTSCAGAISRRVFPLCEMGLAALGLVGAESKDGWVPIARNGEAHLYALRREQSC